MTPSHSLSLTLTHSHSVSLNMVIGANGTGKSTVLNAICLGLGGDPKLLGRADDLRAFIRHGEAVATVEIHLAPHPGRPAHVFKRVLDANKGSASAKSRGRGSSTCFINNEHVSLKQVRHVVRNVYQISIDNLCTFLPQDKVGDFSGFTDAQRLLETEKTLSGRGVVALAENPDEDDDGEDCNQYYYKLHQELIQAEEEVRSSKGNVDTVRDQLAKITHELDQLQREKERMEERVRAVEQAALCKKKLLWLQFEDMREQALIVRDQKAEIKVQLKAAGEVLQPLQDRHTRAATAHKEYAAINSDLEKQIQLHTRQLKKQTEKFELHDDQLEEATLELHSLEARRNTLEAEYQASLTSLEHYEGMGVQSHEEIDAEWKETTTRAKQTHTDYNQAKFKIRSQDALLKEMEGRAEKEQLKLSKMQDDSKMRKQRIFRENPNLAKICQYLETHKNEFRRPVWGPIVCEVTTKSHNASAFLEYQVANNILKGFVVETQEDYIQLLNIAKKVLKVPIAILKVQNGRLKDTGRVYSDQKMNILKNEHGVLGYMDESFTAPDPVMQALRDFGGVDKVLVGGEKTQQSIDEKDLGNFLTARDPASGNQSDRTHTIFSSKGHNSFQFTYKPSRYAKGQYNLQQGDVSGAKMLAPGTNPRAKTDCEEKLAAVHGEMDAFRPSLQELQKEVSELENAAQEASVKVQHAKKRKENFSKFQSKLTRARQKVQDCKEALASDDTDEKKRLLKALFSRMSHSIAALAAHKEERSKMIQATIASAGTLLGKNRAGTAERQAMYVV
jgi:chromosome segregation ATPase